MLSVPDIAPLTPKSPAVFALAASLLLHEIGTELQIAPDLITASQADFVRTRIEAVKLEMNLLEQALAAPQILRRAIG